MVTTCHEYDHQDIPKNGRFKIFNEMKKLKPHFLVHRSDVLFHDRISKTLDLARWNWSKMNNPPSIVALYLHIPCNFMKNDHDT
jgi:phosphodiesterase/alkaline phosphatase D-like protein